MHVPEGAVPSNRQRRILQAIDQHNREHGFPPTLRELGQAVGLRSPSTVLHHMRALEAAGLVRRRERHPRALALTPAGRP